MPSADRTRRSRTTRSERRASAARGGRQSRRSTASIPPVLVLAKARRILDSLSTRERQLSLADLSTRTGLPTSTCLRLVRNLTAEGLLERVGDKYQIGLTIVRWAASALDARGFIATARPTLEWLRDTTEESALLCVRQGGLRVIVGLAESRHAIVRQLRLGDVAPLHVGSTAKVFLAFDPDAVDAIRTQALKRFTDRTITNRRQLATEIERIRTAGYAVSVEESGPGGTGVSAPVFDRSGRMIASIGVSGPMQRMAPERLHTLVPFVVEAARRLSKELGHGAEGT